MARPSQSVSCSSSMRELCESCSSIETRSGAALHRKHINFDTEPLKSDRGYPWDEGIYTLPARGRLRTEVIFFHKESRTLILTDFIENFEPRMIDSLFVRLLIRVGGVLGGMPRDMRLTCSRKKLRSIVATMLSWDPERIIIAHGRWYERNGAAELRRAFRGLLKRE